MFHSASGPYGAATHHYAPVCLNSLLFKTERDLEEMSRLLGKSSDAVQWQRLAEARKRSVQKYLRDQKQGLFFDYDFENGAEIELSLRDYLLPTVGWTGDR